MKRNDGNVETTTTVAIVEDDASVRRSLVRVCMSIGLHCTSFDSAEAFLESTVAADCLITDIGLPGIDGLELQGKMTERQPQLPIIVITGNVDEISEARALANGAAGFFRKPVQVDRLLASIRHAINDHKGVGRAR